MYRIAILEDDPCFIRQLQQECCTILNSLGAEYHIDCFSRVDELLSACLEVKEDIDFLLIKTVLSGQNGISIAQELRQKAIDATLVFIGDNQDFAVQGYDVRARHYLLKADYRQRLKQLLTEDWQRCSQGEYFIFVNGSNRQRALLMDITHLEIFGRKVIVHLPNQQLTQDGKLADLLQKLPGNAFVRCHQGYGVNLRHVLELRHRELILDNGLNLPVSRTYYNSMRQAFAAWYIKE